MLRLKVNRDKGRKELVPMEVSGNLSYVEDGEKIQIVFGVPHNLRDNDYIVFTRNVSGIELIERKNVTVVNGNTVLIDKFSDIEFFVESYEFGKKNLTMSSNGIITTHNILELKTSVQHFVIDDMPERISEDINADYYNVPDIRKKRRCVNDYVLFFNNLYQSSELDANGKYILPQTFSSIKNKTTEAHLAGSDEMLIAYAPVFMTMYDRNTLWLPYADSDEEHYRYIARHAYGSSIFYTDDRFFTNDGVNAILHENTVISKEKYSIHVNLPFNEMFATDTFKDDQLQNRYIDEVGQSHVNKIIDYERQQFSPVYIGKSWTYGQNTPINDDDLKDVTEIEFNLHFRKKKVIDGKEWMSDATTYWNNYGIGQDSNGKHVLTIRDGKGGLRVNDADILSYLNFNDADVYYSKSKVAKSFIRLSFYDKPSRKNQSLLFYSTIFLDTGKLYTKFVNAKVMNEDTSYVDMSSTKYVSKEYQNNNENKDKYRLSSSLSCSDKYNMSGSSEGFYLYMFPDMIQGNQIHEVYMKVEFNHAKYGITVPMTLPVNNNNIIKATNDETFPIHYMKKDANGKYTEIDINMLNRDMYIKVWLKYDFINNRYVWFLPMGEGDNIGKKLVFNLFEPRVNGYEEKYSDIVATETGINEEGGEEGGGSGSGGSGSVNRLIDLYITGNLSIPEMYTCPIICFDKDGGVSQIAHIVLNYPDNRTSSISKMYNIKDNTVLDLSIEIVGIVCPTGSNVVIYDNSVPSNMVELKSGNLSLGNNYFDVPFNYYDLPISATTGRRVINLYVDVNKN